MKLTKISIRPRYVRCPHCQEKYLKLLDKKFICEGCDYEGPSSFFLDFYHNGRQQIFCDERGILIDTKARADLLAEQISYEINHGTFNPDKYKKADLKKYWVASLLDTFWETKKKEIAPSSFANFRKYGEVAKSYFGAKDVRELRKIHLVEWKHDLEGKGLSPGSVSNYLIFFKSFLNWCRSDLEIGNVVPTFPKVEFVEPQIAWLSIEDQRKLLAVCDEKYFPIILFLMVSGIRPGEARALKCGDVDLDKDFIKVHATWSGNVYRNRRKGRGAKSFLIPIHNDIRSYIFQRVKNSTSGAWLFYNPNTGGPITTNTLERVWHRIKDRAGITYPLRLYDATRHSVASQLVSSGQSIYVVKQVLGHTMIETTEKYAQVDLEAKRKAINTISLLEKKEQKLIEAKK